MTDYNQAIELQADFAKAYDRRGLAEGAEGDLKDAVADYTTAISLAPKDADA